MEDSREKEDGHNIPAAKPSKTSKKKRKQQDKGAPRRPLSAYNIFFQEQRALILQQKEAGVTPDDLKETIRISVAQFEQEGHKKPAVGRKRRKPGLFETMARTIADRWKNISGDELAKYTEKAEAERRRYREETEIYHRKLIKKSLAASKMFGAHDSTHAPTDTLVTGVANPSAAGNGYAASSPMPSISPSVAQWNQNTQLGPVGAFSNAQLGFPFLAQQNQQLLAQQQLAAEMFQMRQTSMQLNALSSGQPYTHDSVAERVQPSAVGYSHPSTIGATMMSSTGYPASYPAHSYTQTLQPDSFSGNGGGAAPMADPREVGHQQAMLQPRQEHPQQQHPQQPHHQHAYQHQYPPQPYQHQQSLQHGGTNDYHQASYGEDPHEPYPADHQEGYGGPRQF